MATNTLSNSFLFTQENYTTAAAASVVTKTFTNPLGYILISNTHATNAASLSFDGTNFITLAAAMSLELWPAALYSYKVKDAVDNSHATLQCVYGSEK